MKQKTAGKLIRSMVIALMLVVVCLSILIGGTKWINKVFGIERTDETAGDEPVLEFVTGESVRPLPEVAIQALFVTDEDGELTRCYFTVLDCLEEKLEFYVVPLDTRLQLSTELYQALVTKNTRLAQVNTLQGLYRCFTPDEAAEYTVKVLDEAVGVKTDYYTVMPEKCCELILKENAEDYAYGTFFKDDLQAQVTEAGSMKAYLTGIWEQCICSVSVESKLYYLETYEGLTNLRVSCRTVAGEQHNNGYVPEGSGLR